MNQEQAFLAAVAKVRAFKHDENGLLHLEDANGQAILRLTRDEIR